MLITLSTTVYRISKITGACVGGIRRTRALGWFDAESGETRNVTPSLGLVSQERIGFGTIASLKLSIRPGIIRGRIAGASVIRCGDGGSSGVAFPAPAWSAFLSRKVPPITAALITSRSTMFLFKPAVNLRFMSLHALLQQKLGVSIEPWASAAGVTRL